MSKNKTKTGEAFFSPGPDGAPHSEPPCIAAGGAPPVVEELPAFISPGHSSAPGSILAAHDADFVSRYRPLHDFLTLQGIGGKARRTGTVLVFAEDGKWKACVTDRDGGFYAFASNSDLQGLLISVDQGLRAGTLDWRASKAYKK